ncbi:MAG: RNA polymerase subunit sigma-24 [Flavobacteriaceae bacterium]|nr:RNA polymerase subunit sigma-24 [Flavobacteriaceae bacterium]|tara:strand:- start:614 stop:1207 length:594 start_codon:yes stop_codon:yes gene_type:complete
MQTSDPKYNNDSILVENYINGDESSLDKLIQKHKSRIYNFIFSKVLNRDIAEDIFQDTFIKVIKTLKRGFYNEEGKFLPWIMRIAHNLVIDHFRRSNRIPKFENNSEYDIFQNLSDSSLNAEKSIIKNQVSTDLQHLVDELPDDQKDVVIMRLYRDMSFKEIAENTGVSINTALGRMRYAIINLRKMINDNQIILSH